MFTGTFQRRDILVEREEGGYPAEYLLSRIRGKRAFLITEWDPLIADTVPLESLRSPRYHGLSADRSSASLWSSLLSGYRWAYLQMDKPLREIFRPFFLYSELRTLFFCLRMRAAGEDVRIEQLLENSLFSRGMRQVLLKRADLPETLAEVEKFFLPLSIRFRGLKKRYASEGFRGVEQHLTNCYLEYVIGTGLDPVVREFFVRLIDARNLIALYKHLRWELKDEPPFIRGGSIKVSRLRTVQRSEAVFEVAALIRKATGTVPGSTDPTAIENSLYRGMTRFLRKKGREISGVGVILDYLWRCSVEVTNLGIILYGKDIEREALRAELVL